MGRGRKQVRGKGRGEETGEGQGHRAGERTGGKIRDRTGARTESGDWTGATAVGRRKKRKEKNTMRNETFDAKKDVERKNF